MGNNIENIIACCIHFVFRARKGKNIRRVEGAEEIIRRVADETCRAEGAELLQLGFGLLPTSSPQHNAQPFYSENTVHMTVMFRREVDFRAFTGRFRKETTKELFRLDNIGSRAANSIWNKTYYAADEWHYNPDDAIQFVAQQNRLKR